MVRRTGVAEHQAVDPVVIFKAVKDFEPETVAIEGNEGVEVIGGTRNA